MISATNNSKIKELMKLKQKKYRQTTGYYLIEGWHLVQEALKANQVVTLISVDLFDSDIELLHVSENVMAKLSFTKSPAGIMAKCKMNHHNQLIDGKRYLLLDDLQDPGNVGTLIRTALAFNIDQVILSNNCVDLYNDKVLRAMQGANFHLNCIYGDLKGMIQQLQQNNVIVVGSALENGQDISTIARSDKMAFVVGNEGNGMNPEILSVCNQIGYIPINTIESLNVAIAGSILMYHFQ